MGELPELSVAGAQVCDTINSMRGPKAPALVRLTQELPDQLKLVKREIEARWNNPEPVAVVQQGSGSNTDSGSDDGSNTGSGSGSDEANATSTASTSEQNAVRRRKGIEMHNE